MRKMVLAFALITAACGRGDIRQQRLPDARDVNAIGEVARALSGEGGNDSEKMLFTAWAMRQNMVDTGMMADPTPRYSPATVGEAINEQRQIITEQRATHQRAMAAQAAENARVDADNAHIMTRNAEIELRTSGQVSEVTASYLREHHLPIPTR